MGEKNLTVMCGCVTGIGGMRGSYWCSRLCCPSLSWEGEKKKQISKVSDLPGAIIMTFLQLAFRINPFPLDISQGDTMRHQEVASAGGSREEMCQQHSTVPRMGEMLG